MRPFPPAEDLSFLVGNELSNVTLQPYQVDFHFVQGSTLIIELGLEFIDLDGRTQVHDPQHRLGPDPVRFHTLIGERVSQLDRSDYRLTLTFDSGRKLTVLSDERPYEAGHITVCGYDARGVLHQSGMIIF